MSGGKCPTSPDRPVGPNSGRYPGVRRLSELRDCHVAVCEAAIPDDLAENGDRDFLGLDGSDVEAGRSVQGG